MSPLHEHRDVSSKNTYHLLQPLVFSSSFYIYKNKVFRSYLKAKRYIRSKKFKSVRAYQEWSASSKRPDDIPSNPNLVYVDQWSGWEEYLGKATIS